MSANLENSAVATELEKVSFHSNPKEGQCQGMFKLGARVSFPPAFGAQVPSRPWARTLRAVHFVLDAPRESGLGVLMPSSPGRGGHQVGRAMHCTSITLTGHHESGKMRGHRGQ